MSATSTFKTCPNCATQSPGNRIFCIECGASLTDVIPETGLLRVEQSQFSLPDYLRDDPYRKTHLRSFFADETGTGSGLVWSGAIASAGAVIFTPLDGFGLAVLILGVVLVVGGFWRMRQNAEALSRAGLSIMILGMVALGVVLFQALGPNRDQVTTAAPPRVPVEQTEVAGDNPAAPVSNGVNQAMLGATADHAGVYPGPGPLGRPVTRWRQFVGGEVYSSPVVVDGTVYVGTKSGFLAAYDLATGQERWRFDLGGYIVRATPAVADGVAYIGAGYGLFAVDVETGTERWRMPIRFAGAASPTVAGDTVFIATQEGHVYAVDTATGEERWHYEADGLIFGAPAVFGDNVYFASDTGGINVMTATSGRANWRVKLEAPIRGAPAVSLDGVVFNSELPGVFAFDADTGDLLWQTAVGGEASPSLADDLVIFGSDENGLYAAEMATGAIRWLFPTGNPVLTPAAIVDDTVYVSSGATLYAIDLESGVATWTYPAGDLILTAPAIADGLVVFGSRDGFLYAIGGDGAPTVDES
jgi:outer membrane protein assembly factor BamB